MTETRPVLRLVPDPPPDPPVCAFSYLHGAPVCREPIRHVIYGDPFCAVHGGRMLMLLGSAS